MKDTVKKMEVKSQTGRKYLQITFDKSTQNLTVRKLTTQLKIGKEFLKMFYLRGYASGKKHT